MSKKVTVSTIGLTVVTETIRAAIFKTVTPLAVEQSISENFPHADRSWTFYGLDEGSNYIFKIQKYVGAVWVDITGYSFTFTADSSSLIYKVPITIQVGVTVGLTAGATSAVFDGTGGKDDWRGFTIFPERLGAGTMKIGIDYNWDPATGTWTLINYGDSFQNTEYFFIQFSLITSSTGGGQVLSGKQFQSTSVITADYTILSTDFGNKLIVNGTGLSVALTLPDAFTIPENKLLYIESGVGSHKSVVINTHDNTQKIDWLEGNRIALYMGRCETIVLYKQVIDSTHHIWRIHEADGNFKTVGRTFHSYSDTAEELNAVPLDGGGTSGLSAVAYARLYNDHVLKQDPSKIVSYTDWSVGNNKLKYSTVNGSGFFHIPDTRDLFTRNTGTGRDVGIYQGHAIVKHRHEGTVGTLPTSLFGIGLIARLIGRYAGTQTGFTDLTSEPVDSGGNTLSNMDTETRPTNNSQNQFVIV